MVAGYGLWIRRRVETERISFSFGSCEQLAKWELCAVLVIGLFASGLLSMVEAAAFAAAYVIVIQVLSQRYSLYRELPGVLVRTGVLVGAVLILSHRPWVYLHSALWKLSQIYLEWCRENIDKLMFLLMLNLLLLALGSIIEVIRRW